MHSRNGSGRHHSASNGRPFTFQWNPLAIHPHAVGHWGSTAYGGVQWPMITQRSRKMAYFPAEFGKFHWTLNQCDSHRSPVKPIRLYCTSLYPSGCSLSSWSTGVQCFTLHSVGRCWSLIASIVFYRINELSEVPSIETPCQIASK
jgi:hypothetical protein